MNDNGKSDKPIVPLKGANNEQGRPCSTERLEGRGLAKGNSGEQTRFWTQGQVDLQHALDRIRTAARKDKKLKLTALWHHVYNVNRLRQAYYALKRSAAPGIDEVTWHSYGERLEENLKDLSTRLEAGEKIDSRKVKKHKNDVFRLFQVLSPEQRLELPDAIADDMQRFLDALSENTDLSLKPFGLNGLGVLDVVARLRQIYQMS